MFTYVNLFNETQPHQMDILINFYNSFNKKEKVLFYILCFATLSTLISLITKDRYVRVLKKLFFLLPEDRA